MVSRGDLRIGDAEREAAAGSLREHYVQGRLTLEEFNQRLDAVFKATTQNQLSQITHDLPYAAAPTSPLTVGGGAGGGPERARREDWSGYAGRRRHRLGMFPVIIAALAAWLVVLDLHLRMFPWPGKLAIFLAIFAVARGLVRRVFGIGWGRGRTRGFCGCGRRGGGRYTGGPWSSDR